MTLSAFAESAVIVNLVQLLTGRGISPAAPPGPWAWAARARSPGACATGAGRPQQRAGPGLPAAIVALGLGVQPPSADWGVIVARG